MKSEWPLRNISEVADFLNFRRVPLKSLDRDKRPGTYPYYGASGIVDFIDDYIFDGEFLLISEDGENLRTRNTPIAFKASGKFWVNNHAHILAEKEEGILDYLTYYFSKLDLTPYITGAVQPKLNKANLDSIDIPVPPKNERLSIVGILNSLSRRIEVNRQTNQTLEKIAQAIFKSWFVDFEPTRAKIAARDRWLALHEVIETSSPTCYSAEFDSANQPTQTLEDAMTQAAMAAISGKAPEELEQLSSEQQKNLRNIAALFPGSLVDSELGEIPEGWKVKSLSEVIEIVGGGTPKRNEEKYWNGSIPWFSMRDVPNDSDVFVVSTVEKITSLGLEKSSAKLLPKGTTIITARGTVGKLALTGVPMCINQSCYGVRPIDGIGQYFNYFNLREAVDTLLRNVHGAVFDTITTKTFDSYSMAASDIGLIQVFDDLVGPLLRRIEANVRQNATLTDFRNSLLPKLLSGEISPVSTTAYAEVPC